MILNFEQYEQNSRNKTPTKNSERPGFSLSSRDSKHSTNHVSNTFEIDTKNSELFNNSDNSLIQNSSMQKITPQSSLQIMKSRTPQKIERSLNDQTNSSQQKIDPNLSQQKINQQEVDIQKIQVYKDEVQRLRLILKDRQDKEQRYITKIQSLEKEVLNLKDYLKKSEFNLEQNMEKSKNENNRLCKTINDLLLSKKQDQQRPYDTQKDNTNILNQLSFLEKKLKLIEMHASEIQPQQKIMQNFVHKPNNIQKIENNSQEIQINESLKNENIKIMKENHFLQKIILNMCDKTKYQNQNQQVYQDTQNKENNFKQEPLISYFRLLQIQKKLQKQL